VDCIDMLYEQDNLQNWHWQLPDPVSRRVDIIATDAAQDRAA
jgi:electron transport complex protein RnfB